MTDEEIFKSLYVLNKSAKKSRDTQKKASAENRSAVFKRAKQRKDFIYTVKHLVMEKLIADEKLKFIGIHKQDINGHSFYLVYYKSEMGFSYHRPATKKEIKDFESAEKMPMTVVPATQNYAHDIGYKKAMEILLSYIGKTKEEIKKSGTSQFKS